MNLLCPSDKASETVHLRSKFMGPPYPKDGGRPGITLSLKRLFSTNHSRGHDVFHALVDGHIDGGYFFTRQRHSESTNLVTERNIDGDHSLSIERFWEPLFTR